MDSQPKHSSASCCTGDLDHPERDGARFQSCCCSGSSSQSPAAPASTSWEQTATDNDGAPSAAFAMRDLEGSDWRVLAVPPRGTQRGEHRRGHRTHGPDPSNDTILQIIDNPLSAAEGGRTIHLSIHPVGKEGRQRAGSIRPITT